MSGSERGSVVSAPSPISEGPSEVDGNTSTTSSIISPPVKLSRTGGLFSPTSRRQSRGYRDGVGTKLSIIDIRQQLNDQLKCLDIKLETEVSIVLELQEFFKRRAEVEQEYARNLDKLVKTMITRHRAEKQKQEQWATMSTYACWKHLLGITRKQSQDHFTISEIYSNQMVSRLAEVVDNSQRIFRKCREVGSESHEDMMKVLNELQNAMKTYHIYQNDSKQAESKLRNVESQKQKVEQQLANKNSTSRKLKGLERQTDKKKQKYSDNSLKALRARNDYLLSIDAANAAIGKYFSDDISDLMDCMDFGYHNSVGRAMMMYLGIHEHQKMSHSKFVDSLNKCITDLDSKADKQKFMELNNVYFMLPKKFEFQSFKGDEVCQISAQKEVQEDLSKRYINMETTLNTLMVENDEVWKTLETTEKTLVDTIQVRDYDTTKFFAEDSAPPKSPHETSRYKVDRIETECYYLQKFREYTLSCNRLARLQAKHAAIQKALGEHQEDGPSGPPAPPPKPKKRRIGHTPPVGQPRLFGGSMEEYIEATGQEIPLIIKSCIRVINLYGLQHQGVFRVSGAQVEINQFKSTFESGEDALADIMDASQMNSVAGVLKLYFRELREPLFPLHLFDALVECTREREMNKRVERIKELLQGLPRPVFVGMRYLFAFLNHLTEYSDENMMDPYNLAICFGPTLLPIPPDRDQVTFQSSVNEIIKIIIVSQEEIFPNNGGEIYEKMILDRRNSIDNLEDDDDTSSTPSDEEEPDVLEVTARFDFEARSARELSFKRGDSLVLYSQMSKDWWEGCFQGKEGLIPDKYIVLKNADDNRSHLSHEDEKNLMTTSMTLPSKPGRQSSDDSGLDASDKSLSQPNVAVRETDILDTDLPSPTTTNNAMMTTTTTVSIVEGGSVVIGGGGGTDKLPPPPSGDKDRHSLSGPVWVKDEAVVIRSEENNKREDLSYMPATSTPVITAPPLSSPSLLPQQQQQQPPSTPKTSSTTTTTTVVPPDPSSMDEIDSSVTIRSRDESVRLSDEVSIISPDTTSEDLSVDIDVALEEVMAGLKSLEMQQQHDKRMSLPVVKVKQTPKHTPDLVLDLPDDNRSNLSSETSEADSPTNISAAETFAQSNQGTLKKGVPMSSSSGRKYEGVVGNRLSIQSEPGDLARNREHDPNAMILSQGPMTTFSITGLKKSQSAMPNKGQTVDSAYHHSPNPSSSSGQISSSSPHAPPPVAQKPKPPMKVKPPVMKKPAARPEGSQLPSSVQPPPP